MRKKKEESEDRTFKVRKENSSTSFRSRANSQSRSRHASAVDRAVETLKGRERHTSMVDRIEAWGEGWVGGLPDLLQYYIGGSLESLLQYFSFEMKMEGYSPFSALN